MNLKLNASMCLCHIATTVRHVEAANSILFYIAAAFAEENSCITYRRSKRVFSLLLHSTNIHLISKMFFRLCW